MVKILNSRITIQFSMQNNYRADFCEFFSDDDNDSLGGLFGGSGKAGGGGGGKSSTAAPRAKATASNLFGNDDADVASMCKFSKVSSLN